jgi:transcriptional regulator with XRE-family HTH domain
VSALRKRVGGRIRELRLARGLTQEEVGERARLSYKFIGEVERGIGNPTLETLADIAHALDVEIVDLVDDRREPIAIGTLTERDYALVRETRDSLQTMLERLGGRKPKRSRR